ncbi:MAG: hypothetical protein L6R36_004915 [Xanthoria steineri]|nr:MAG: hypothetical protein L6R36_004915 [Xanthoria steineri]
MPQRVLDEKDQSNTTRSWRDLSKEEVRAIKLINKGTRSERKKADSQALSTEKIKAADAVQNSSASATIDRLCREKVNDDAVYARTGINHGLRLPNPLTTTHGLQLVPLAPPQPLAPSQRTT